MVENWDYRPLAMEEIPEDPRPGSKLAKIIDPANTGDNEVKGLTVFKDKIPPRDNIPLP
jgi:hypothetical protein